ncbi:MAG TPA: cellulase family glycosylhydrolase, partial [Anaerolineaceae bacterium]
MKITIDGAQFKDEFGRTLMLRGVNLGGGSKVPYQPDGATHNREGFFNHRQVSFVGRPFPLAEADEHFRRLKAWGFTFLRFLVTWEAIEHAGPGQYDSEYLDYVRAVVMKAGEYGISLFIDPHQDMWSRFSGGDGAPGWTLEAAGLDMTHFGESGAAIVHQTHGDPFPKMIWPTNEGKLATATMFTLFFGGNDFAPQTKVDGEPIQEYLQRHYINAILQVVERLKDLTNVVGYDTLNEPLAGYIGWQDLNRKGGELNLGESPTPFQAMLFGSGLPQEVVVWKLGLASLVKDGTRRLNPGRVRAWLAGRECIWRQHGVWNLDAAGNPNLLRPDYFKQVNGHPVEFNRDYFVPFARRCAGVIRAADPRALIFVESVAG